MIDTLCKSDKTAIYDFHTKPQDNFASTTFNSKRKYETKEIITQPNNGPRLNWKEAPFTP